MTAVRSNVIFVDLVQCGMLKATRFPKVPAQKFCWIFLKCRVCIRQISLCLRGRLCECKNVCIQCHVQTESLCTGFCGTRITKGKGWCGTKREIFVPEQSEKMIATKSSSPGQPDLMSSMSCVAGFLPQLNFTVNAHSKVCYIFANLRHKVQAVKISSCSLFWWQLL